MILEYYLPKGVAVSLFYPAYDGEWSSQYVTSPAGLDSEASLDKAAFADCTNEWTEIGSSGVGYLDLTAGEMDNGNIVVQTKSSTAGVNFPLIVIRTYTEINANVVNWKGSAAPAMTGDAFARLGAPVGASISADITTVDTVANNTYAIVNNGTYGNSALKGLIDIIDGIVDAIKLKTDNIPASPAAVGSAMTLHADYDAAKTAASQTSVDAIDTVVDALAVAISELNDIDGDDVQTAVEARLTAARTALTEMPSAYTGSLVAILQALAIPGFGNTLFDRLTGALQFLKADGTTVLGEGTATDDGDETFKGAIETPAP